MVKSTVIGRFRLDSGEGDKGRIEREPRATLTAQLATLLLVNRETGVQTRLDYQSGTRNDILLGVHKKIFTQAQMLSAMSQRC